MLIRRLWSLTYPRTERGAGAADSYGGSIAPDEWVARGPRSRIRHNLGKRYTPLRGANKAAACRRPPAGGFGRPCPRLAQNVFCCETAICLKSGVKRKWPARAPNVANDRQRTCNRTAQNSEFDRVRTPTKFVSDASAKITDRQAIGSGSRIGSGAQEPRGPKVRVAIFKAAEDTIAKGVVDAASHGPAGAIAAIGGERGATDKRVRRRWIPPGQTAGAKHQKAVKRDTEPAADRRIVLERRRDRERPAEENSDCAKRRECLIVADYVRPLPIGFKAGNELADLIVAADKRPANGPFMP